MAIFTHLIPAKHGHGKRDMTSGHDDSTGRRRHRRRRRTTTHGHHHRHHHGHNW